MKQKIIRILIIVVVVAGVIFVTQRNTRGQYIKLAGLTQGTSYHITYQSRRGRNLQRQIDSLLTDFDRSLSIYLPTSVVSKINRNESDVEADEKLITVLNKAFEVNETTGGAFDITVAPLVNAWGFGFTSASSTDSATIDSLMQFVGMDKIRLNGTKIEKADPRVMLDFNAIAQGYSVDVVSAYLRKLGIKHYMVEIGGEVSTLGHNDKGNIWRIGIDKPLEGNMIPGSDLQAILQLNRKSLATSGNYRKFYEKDGLKYSHTVNPVTGYPVMSNLLSVTVVADDCMTADAYATSFMVMGLEKAKVFLEKHKFLDAYLIYSDEKGQFRVYFTGGFSRYLAEQLQ
ncbi:MAG: FAD:protein FMN transferase [Bacteroidales bacterium]|nr:FAD:protein FMN transferase [Bacteroidales bacterium]